MWGGTQTDFVRFWFSFPRGYLFKLRTDEPPVLSILLKCSLLSPYRLSFPGPSKASSFFFAPARLKGSACFFGGIVFVLVKWPIVGLLVEVFGFINLFGNSFPWVLLLLRNVPVLGTMLSLPMVAPVR